MAEKLELMKHQRYALGCMGAMDHLAIYYEAGTGKTAIALTWLISAMRDGKVGNALIVCPASLTNNWASSIDGMMRFEGVTEADVEALKARTTIVSYRRTLGDREVRVFKRGGRECKSTIYHPKAEFDREWDAIILDEAHFLGGHSSGQTQVCLELARKARYRYILTGTPVSGSAKGGGKDWQKLYGQMRFLEPDIWPSWTAFCGRYVASLDKWFKPDSYNERACEELIQAHGIFARLEDCVDMPGFTDTDIACPLAEKKVYKDVREMCLDAYNIDPQTGGSTFGKLLQVCSGHLRDDDGRILQLKTSKDEALEDILLGTDDKVVIFCRYTPSVDRCAEIARKIGRKTVIFDGRRTEDTSVKFQKGDATVIVAQYLAGGAGLDLFASHTMVMYEPTLSSLELAQSRARIYRKGQTEKCRYLCLTTPGTVEDKVWKSVLNGVDVTAEMLREYSLGS